MAEDAISRLRHRVKTHQAALQLAEQLGWPDELSVQIRETLLRLDEAKACLHTVEELDPGPLDPFDT